MNAKNQLTRRDALGVAGFSAGFAFFSSRALGRAGSPAPSEKLNIAVVGVGGRGSVCLDNLKEHNIVALCDVDWRQPQSSWPRALKIASGYPNAKRFNDYRVMFDEMDKSFDAVVVATPDHTHAVIAMAAMKRRKHVYCEKPLAHSVNEIRALAAAAKKYKVATQVGNQGHASEDTRRAVEWVRDGAIGTVKEVHITHFEGSGSGPVPGRSREAQLARLKEQHPVPEGLDWDLWLGPVPHRAYHPLYAPHSWRNWLAFGTGRLGDYTCHYLDCVSWALDLDLPDQVEAENSPSYDVRENTDTFPDYSTIRYRFPAKGKRAPVTLTWHADKLIPALPGFGPNVLPKAGGVLVGSRGSMLFGPMYRTKPDQSEAGMVRLYPEELDKSYKRPAESIPRTKGHWAEWAECCKTGKQPGSNFGWGGALSEVGTLGNIAIRRPGKVLDWDARKSRFTNDDEANAMVRRKYRDGWSL